MGVVSGLGVAVLTSVFIPVSGGQVGNPDSEGNIDYDKQDEGNIDYDK